MTKTTIGKIATVLLAMWAKRKAGPRGEATLVDPHLNRSSGAAGIYGQAFQQGAIQDPGPDPFAPVGGG